MSNLTLTNRNQFIPNLKIILESIDTFFKYLPYERKGELNYSLTYFYQDTLTFCSILEIISEVERCLKYQVIEKIEIEISAEIVFTQDVIINEKEVNLFYHGHLIVTDTAALIFWNWYQSSPKVEVKLTTIMLPEVILSLFTNFQEAILDIITKHE